MQQYMSVIGDSLDFVRMPRHGPKEQRTIEEARPTVLGCWVVLARALASCVPRYRPTLGVGTLVAAGYLFGVFLFSQTNVRYFAPAWIVLIPLLRRAPGCRLRFSCGGPGLRRSECRKRRADSWFKGGRRKRVAVPWRLRPLLACSPSIFYRNDMSTLAEIEAAVETLPRPEQERLLSFLAERMGREVAAPVQSDDPFEEMIGAFAGPADATGRKAEEILYGMGA